MPLAEIRALERMFEPKQTLIKRLREQIKELMTSASYAVKRHLDPDAFKQLDNYTSFRYRTQQPLQERVSLGRPMGPS